MQLKAVRKTGETQVEVCLDSEGSGLPVIETGVPLLDQMLSLMAVAGRFELRISARGDLETGDHHSVEDVGIALGKALSSVSSGTGSSHVPCGQSLATVVLSFGHPAYKGEAEFEALVLGGMALENFHHFLSSLAFNGRFTLHLQVEGGKDEEKIEASMMALGRALGRALRDKYLFDEKK